MCHHVDRQIDWNDVETRAEDEGADEASEFAFEPEKERDVDVELDIEDPLATDD